MKLKTFDTLKRTHLEERTSLHSNLKDGIFSHEKLKEERASITMMIIIAFLACMILLMGLYWKATNSQVTVLQTEQRIKEIYGNDVERVNEIYEELKRQESNEVQSTEP